MIIATRFADCSPNDHQEDLALMHRSHMAGSLWRSQRFAERQAARAANCGSALPGATGAGTDPTLDIYVKWDQCGYVVTGETNPLHFSGPRQAAEHAANKMFPQGGRLSRITKNHYQARAK